MFSHILLATDGSPHALEAAVAAAALAKKFDARLTIVNVAHHLSIFGQDTKPRGTAEICCCEKQQREALCNTGLVVESMDVVCRVLRKSGNPAEQIVQAAGDIGADLIVIGSRGHRDIRSFLLGSVSDGVLHHAHCPVLIIRTLDKLAQDMLFHNILLASDGSECALKATEAGAEIAREFNSKLTILNVVQPAIYSDPYVGVIACDLSGEYAEDMHEKIVCTAGSIADTYDVPYVSREEIGNAAAEIVRVAEEEKCGLIVLGSRGLGTIEAFVVGSVSERVAHSTHCPVLIMK